MSLSAALLVVGVILAVAAGLYVGSATHRRLELRQQQRRKPAARVREAATKGVFRLWKWTRKRGDE